MIPRFFDFFDLDFFLLALRYTLGEQATLDRELPLCVGGGVGLIIGGVFSSGIYATGPVPGAKYNYADASPGEMERARQDRSGVQAPWRAARRGGAAVPAAPSGGRIGHSRRIPAGPGDRQPRPLASRHPGRAVGRAEAGRPYPRRRADAVEASEAEGSSSRLEWLAHYRRSVEDFETAAASRDRRERTRKERGGAVPEGMTIAGTYPMLYAFFDERTAFGVMRSRGRWRRRSPAAPSGVAVLGLATEVGKLTRGERRSSSNGSSPTSPGACRWR